MKRARSGLAWFLLLALFIVADCSKGGDLNNAEAYKKRAKSNFLKYQQLTNETRNVPLLATQSKSGTDEFYRDVSSQKKDLLDSIISDLSMALKIDPDDAQAYYGRGWAYLRRGYYDSAIADFSRFIEFDPLYAKAYSNRGVAFAKKNKLDQALADYEQTLKLDPTDYIAVFNKADALEKLGRKKEALEIYQLILQKAPSEFADEIGDARIRIRKLDR